MTSAARLRADVERFAFAAALRYPDLVDESGLRGEHFATEPLAEAFAALPRCLMRTDDGRVAALHVATESGVPLETLRPALAAAVYNPDQAREWWGRLRDLAGADALVAALRAVVSRDRPSEDATATLLAQLEQLVRDFGDHEVERELETLDDVAARYIDGRTEELRLGRRRGVQTGLELFDRWGGGLNAGEVTTIVAAGGVGKSTVAFDLARRVARDGAPTLVCEAEMTAHQTGQREAHAALGRAIGAEEATAPELHEALEEIRGAGHAERVFFDFRSRPNAAQVLASARRLQHRHGLGLLIFDHLGCWDVERPRAGEQEQIALAMQQAKDVAKILDVPLVLLTHTNRAGEIRGSERIRDISDNVLLLRREADDPRAPTEARFLKARQTGRTWSAMRLSYSLKWQTFIERGDGDHPAGPRAVDRPTGGADHGADIPF